MPEILNKISELRELFRQRFGVEVIIQIKAHKTRNPHMNQELANYVSHELANMVELEEISLYYNSQNDFGNRRWVTLQTRAGFEFAGHY